MSGCKAGTDPLVLNKQDIFFVSQGTLSVLGILNVGLSILVSYSLSSAMGLMYGPMHSSLPFLLLGLGIDDMFVIVQTYDNLKPSAKASLDIPSRSGP